MQKKILSLSWPPISAWSRRLALLAPLLLASCGGGGVGETPTAALPGSLPGSLTKKAALPRIGGMPSDFNGDGRADLIGSFWESSPCSTPDNPIYSRVLKIGLRQADGSILVQPVGLDRCDANDRLYELVDSADFDGDGRADLLLNLLLTWGYPKGAELALMDGRTVRKRIVLPLAGGEQVIAAADFDGDGRPDILVRGGDIPNTRYSVLLMHGTEVASRHLLIDNNPRRARWGREEVLQILDVDGDGRADLLTERSGTERSIQGLRRLWYMDGARPRQVQALLSPGKLVETGDFNGDGHTDLLLSERYDGPMVVRLLREGQILEERAIVQGNLPATVIDADGDGKDDIVLGGVALWRMDGVWVKDTTALYAPETPTEGVRSYLQLAALGGERSLLAARVVETSWPRPYSRMESLAQLAWGQGGLVARPLALLPSSTIEVTPFIEAYPDISSAWRRAQQGRGAGGSR